MILWLVKSTKRRILTLDGADVSASAGGAGDSVSNPGPGEI